MIHHRAFVYLISTRTGPFHFIAKLSQNGNRGFWHGLELFTIISFHDFVNLLLDHIKLRQSVIVREVFTLYSSYKMLDCLFILNYLLVPQDWAKNWQRVLDICGMTSARHTMTSKLSS